MNDIESFVEKHFAMAQVKVKHVVPDYLKTYTVRSGSQAILAKKLQPLQPQEQTTYSPDTNVTTTFALSSNSALFLGQESFFTCRVRFQADGSAGPDNNMVVLGKGGFHNLLLSHELRVLNDGAMIEKLNRYHRVQNIIGMYYEDLNYIEQFGHLYLDNTVVSPDRTFPIETLVIAGGVVSSINGSTSVQQYFTSEDIDVEMAVMVEGKAYSFYLDEGGVLTSDVYGGVLPNDTYYGVHMIVRNKRRMIRWAGEYSPWFEVCFQLKSHFLNQTLPLPLMKSGIEVILNWQQAKFAFAAHAETEGASFTYEIEVPRLQAMFAIPHPDIIQMYAEQWKSPDGILFHIPQYHVRPYVSTASGGQSDTFTIQPGVRAANKVFIGITNQSDSQNQLKQKDIYNYTNIQTLQLRVGTEEFPHKALSFGVNAEHAPYRFKDALMQCMMAAGVPMNTRIRLNHESWKPALNFEATECVFCISLSRLRPGDGTDELSGVDLQVVPLEILIQRFHAFGYRLGGSNGTNPYSYSNEPPLYWIVIEHDTYFKYQENETGLVR